MVDHQPELFWRKLSVPVQIILRESVLHLNDGRGTELAHVYRAVLVAIADVPHLLDLLFAERLVYPQHQIRERVPVKEAVFATALVRQLKHLEYTEAHEILHGD